MIVRIKDGKKTILADVSKQANWNQTDTEAKDFIKNKPDIPEIIADVSKQADWNQEDTEAKDYIKNKPDLTDVGKQADWNQEDTEAKDFIKNKPDIKAYYVNFNANNGNQDSCPETFKTWHNLAHIPDIIPTKDDSYFLGWSNNPNRDNNLFNSSDAIVLSEENTDLYAIWSDTLIEYPDNPDNSGHITLIEHIENTTDAHGIDSIKSDIAGLQDSISDIIDNGGGGGSGIDNTLLNNHIDNTTTAHGIDTISGLITTISDVLETTVKTNANAIMTAQLTAGGTQAVETSQVRNIYAGTSSMSVNATLATGSIYLQYTE